MQDWMKVTAVGDDFEVELDRRGDPSIDRAWRHRPKNFSDERRLDWTPGRPPRGAYAA